MDTFKKLKQLWKPKHLEHLRYCLKYCGAYFEDRFEYEGDSKNGVIIDGQVYDSSRITAILAIYYTDSKSDYPTAFGDALYLFFTDLVEDDVDILSQLDMEVAV